MSARPYPYSAEQEAWLRDLETTEAPQTRGALHRLSGNGPNFPAGHCCLGRAAVVLGIPEQEAGALGCFDDKTGTLSDRVVGILRLRDSSGKLAKPLTHNPALGCLAEMNDDGRMSFKEIAAYIRANPWNVFLEPDESEKEVA